MRKIIIALVMISFLFLSLVFALIKTPNLVGGWRFEGNANDWSGNGNNGTVNGATLTTGKFGKAYSFDGVDDYVQLPNLGNFSSFTIEGWIRGDGDSLSGATGYNTFIGNAGNNRLLYSMNGLMLAQMGAGNHFSTATAPRGQWNHIAYVYTHTNTTAKWFINGKPDSENVGAITFKQPQRIGAYDLVNYMMNGLIDEVRIYNRALTESEIRQSMMGYAPKEF